MLLFEAVCSLSLLTDANLDSSVPLVNIIDLEKQISSLGK